MSTLTDKTENFDLRTTFPKGVGIIGAARSGLAAAEYFRARGASLFISDTCAAGRLDALLRSQGLQGVPYEAGGHTARLLDCDLIILSPGVRSDLPVLQDARRRGIPVWSELELGFRASRATFLAITGSTGKSTTVSLLGEALVAGGKRAVVAGNIGIPVVSVVATLPDDAWVAAEVSSFQLEAVERFRPLAAAVLNFMKNHLDRYAGEEEYYNAKKQIAKNFTKDNYLVLHGRDRRCVEWAEIMRKRTNVVFFGSAPRDGDVFWYDERTAAIRYRFGGAQGTILDVQDMRLSGPHNYENACAAAALAKAAGIADAGIAEGLKRYGGLPHRLEFVAEVQGVKYYNDSKSTTAESVACAVAAFNGGVHLIAGGRDKGCDFSVVTPLLRRHARSVILIGEAADRMQREWEGAASVSRAGTLEEAVALAAGLARAGETVVLSPGCSSFDMFSSYEERGDRFKKIVSALAREGVMQ